MAYKIYGSEFPDFLVPKRNISFLERKNMHSTIFRMPKGDISFNEYESGNRIQILNSFYTMKDDLQIFGKGESSLLELQFNLSESPILFKDKKNREITTPIMSGNLIHLSTDANQANIFLKKDHSYTTFDVHLPLDFLNKYAGESKSLDIFLENIYADRNSQLLKEPISINAKVCTIIQEMKSCTFEGFARKIYLECKTFELIATLIDKADSTQKNHNLSQPDIDKIKATASLIQKNIDAPLTILELSRIVGINQTKLKTQFKELMKCTIFEYLQQIRMSKAKAYLSDTELSIQEIGILVGYHNVSNFSIAFKNIFGYSPSEFKNSISNLKF